MRYIFLLLFVIIGRYKLNNFLIFIFAWHLVVYCPIAHIVWNPRGAFATNQINDFSGAIPVHILGTLTALVLHFILGKDAVPTSPPVADPEKALFYTFLVWLLWFGFNSGKAHSADAVAAQSIVNTIAATTSSIFCCFFYNLILERTVDSLSMVYAIIIALIAITPASGFVTVGGAMVIAIFSYFFTVIIAQFMLAEGDGNKPYSIVTLHGLAGQSGFLWSAIISYKFVNPAGHNGLTYGRGMPLAYHISFTLATWAVGVLAVGLLAAACNLLFPFGNDVIPASEELVVTNEENEPEKMIELTDNQEAPPDNQEAPSDNQEAPPASEQEETNINKV
jgi:ammonium transporter, Amt family